MRRFGFPGVFGVSRASEVAALRSPMVAVNESAGLVGLKFRCQKNDKLGISQMAHVVALPARRGAFPVRVTLDCFCFRSQLSRFWGREKRLSASPEVAPVSIGLARARFGSGMAPSGVTADWKKGIDGKNLSPRRSGARLHMMNGMAREATQELGG